MTGTSQNRTEPAVWFPAIRAGTGTDIFTERLAGALQKRGIRCEISWLPLRAEYAPWSVARPKPPPWANITHINSWLHDRFIPRDMPVVTTLHSCVHDPAFTPYKSVAQRIYHRAWIRQLEAESLCQASIATAVSDYTAEQAKRVFGRKEICTTHNWIDTAAFCPDARKAPCHPFRLLFVGNLSLRKGADLLPEIMALLGEDFVLHYTGTPAQFPIKRTLPTNMHHLGRLEGVESLVKAYRESDALLFPTRLEGFGLVAAEAQACGRPVISVAGSSLPEVVVHERSGILCTCDAVDELVSAARRLREDIELWRTMGQNAREHVLATFTEEKAIDVYLSIYRTAVSGGRSPNEKAGWRQQ